MSDLISRQETLSILSNLNSAWVGYEKVSGLPTIDAAPVKHGAWVKTGQSFVNPNRFRNYCCSVCGYDIEKTKYNYCPNCGAKMDGERKDDETD